jgi:hypothetical protein
MMDQMRDGKHCPACGRDIGIWSVFTAGLPSRIHCPHCQARLSFADTGVVVACLLAIGLVLGAGAYFFAARFYPITRLEFHLIAAGLTLVLLLALNLAAVLYLRNARVLDVRQSGAQAPSPSDGPGSS